MSTIPLLPPERSHICIAFASELWAHAAAGSGVGVAAGADAAGADAPGAAVAVVDVPHATTSNARTARTGTLRRFVIRYSSNQLWSRTGAMGVPSRDFGGAHSTMFEALQSSAYIRLHPIDPIPCGGPGWRT